MMEELRHWVSLEPTLRRFTIEWSAANELERALPWSVTIWSMQSDQSGPRREPVSERGSTLGWAAIKALQTYYERRD